MGKLKAASALFVQRPVALRNLLLPTFRTSNFFNGECFIVCLERTRLLFVQIRALRFDDPRIFNRKSCEQAPIHLRQLCSAVAERGGDTAFQASGLYGALKPAARTKAPSPLRSTGALQTAFN